MDPFDDIINYSQQTTKHKNDRHTPFKWKWQTGLAMADQSRETFALPDSTGRPFPDCGDWPCICSAPAVTSWILDAS